MKTYSLAAVPTCAGIYYVTNRRTGEIYVGQSNGLRRRHMEWKNAMSMGFGSTNMIMHEALARSPDLDEWFFVVYRELPGATTAELLQAETDEILRLQGLYPDRVLNQQAGKVGGGTIALEDRVVIMTEEGVRVGQSVASRMIGRHVDTVRDKVKWLREQGVKEIMVSDLTMDRRDILKKYSEK